MHETEHSKAPAEQDKRPAPDMSSRTKFTLQLTLPIALVELVLIGIMLGVYALLGKMTAAVWLGAALGFAVSLLNFIAMVVSLLHAEKKENVATAQLWVRLLYVARLAVMLVALIFALKSNRFDPLATLLPLCFMPMAEKLPEFFRRKRGDAN